ncbi:hypothetical protein [Haloplanus salinarum]|uniref:hypothetical protein n=1 Tax=Haloplanus salinarum TaxID=1912324 RepID=UPI00214B943E|nr:hypothetical protein [Haloplanus salinarum]
MPEIEITSEQEERLRALQEEIARDVVGKYGHVRPRDAVEYLLDRYEDDEEADPANAADDADGGDSVGGTEAATARVVDDDDDGEAADGTTDGDPTTGGDDAMLNEMMSLLDTHDDKWGESDGDERYAVELPDGTTEQVRTKDDVKALLFKHYR